MRPFLSTKRVTSLSVQSGGSRSAGACRQALAALRWHVRADDGGHIVAREDPAGLHCHCSPAEAEIRVVAEGDGSRVEIATTVPGLGPIASRDAQSRSAELTRQIAVRIRDAAQR